MARFPSLIPQKGERAMIAGQTGSGKTAFAVWMLLRIDQSPIVIYDTKDEEKFPKLPLSRVVSTQAECDEAVADVSLDYVIFRPPVELQGEPERLDAFLWHHYNQYRGIPAYVDEAGTFHNGHRAYKGLIALMARGRSRGITTIISTQRPVGISKSIRTEAQRIYAFRLADLDDRKSLQAVVPNFASYPLPPKHGFYFFESGEDEPHLFAPVAIDPKFDTGYVDKTNEAEPDAGEHIHGETGEPASKHIWV